MKLKSHIILFISLLLVNLIFCYYIVEDNYSPNIKNKRIPDKVKFKSAQKEEALVIKTDKASGTTKLEINMNDYNGKLVSLELKAKKDPNNPKKLKYKYKDNDDDKSTFVSVKYSDTDDSFKIVDPKKEDKLLYKVKFYTDKIKIEPDSTEYYYQIKKKDSKLKSYIDETNVATSKYDSKKGKLKVKKIIKNQEAKEDLYSTKDLHYLSYSIGVMGLETINPILRSVIVAEILKKGK
jgi:hypothetical protein